MKRIKEFLREHLHEYTDTDGDIVADGLVKRAAALFKVPIPFVEELLAEVIDE